MSLDEAFFSRPSLQVAPDLLGRVIAHGSGAQRVGVRITEVEAYGGTDDPGSHARRGPTPRSAVMFGPSGRLYVYFSYGMHWCVNLVCGPAGTASAVLLRAGDVVEGHQLARSRRPTARTDRDLARGPARLAAALGIDGSLDGADLTGDVEVSDEVSGEAAGGPVRQGPRVGVSGAGGDAAVFPWRFWLDGEPTVSAYRAAVVRAQPRGVAPPGSGTLGADGSGDERSPHAKGRP